MWLKNREICEELPKIIIPPILLSSVQIINVNNFKAVLPFVHIDLRGFSVYFLFVFSDETFI